MIWQSHLHGIGSLWKTVLIIQKDVPLTMTCPHDELTLFDGHFRVNFTLPI